METALSDYTCLGQIDHHERMIIIIIFFPISLLPIQVIDIYVFIMLI